MSDKAYRCPECGKTYVVPSLRLLCEERHANEGNQ